MENNEIDKLFQEHLSSVEMDVDLADVWQSVEPPKKKKRRFFFLGCFMVAALFCIVLSCLYWYKTDNVFIENALAEEAQSTTEQEKGKETVLSLNEKKNKKDLDEEFHSHIMELQQSSSSMPKQRNGEEAIWNEKVVSQKEGFDQPNPPSKNNNTNVKEKNEVTELESTRTEQLKMQIVEPLEIELSNDSITTQKDIAFSFSSDKTEISDAIEKGRLENRVDDFEMPLTIQIASLGNSKIPNDLLIPVDFPLDTSQNKKKAEERIRKFQLGITTGVGSFNTNLSATTPEGDALVAGRKRTETDRFSYNLGTNLDYWISKNIGFSLGFEYQRHFSYFEEKIDFNDYSLTVYRTTYAANSRTIKSNLILNQLHSRVLFNYRLDLRKVKLVLSAGPSYNIYNKGEGKRYGENQEIIDLSQQGNLLQSTSFGLMAKCRIEYPLTKNIQINMGINTHHQSRTIVSNSSVRQRIRISSFSAGLSHFL